MKILKHKARVSAGGFLLLAAGAALLAFPFEVTIAPEWKVRVVDERWQPVPLATVRVTWIHGALEDRVHIRDLMAGEGGTIEFPRQWVRASLWQRLRACTAQGGSRRNALCEPRATVLAFKCGFGADWRGEAYSAHYDGGAKKLETQLVLNRCAAAPPDFACTPDFQDQIPRCPVSR